MGNKNKTKQKMSITEIIFRFFFGFLIPYLAINGLILFIYIQCPRIQVVQKDSNEFEENKIKFSVDCRLPIKDVKVSLLDKDITYSKQDNKYIVDVNDYGTYIIKATALNGAVSIYNAPIENKDTTPPTIDTETVVITGNVLNINIRDNESGINYENLYATLEDGSQINPMAVNKETGNVQFKIETGNKIIVHIEDEYGNISETPFTIA